jgi:endonuclease/exonuclease/phosphatase family metal-dependent hydrolase
MMLNVVTWNVLHRVHAVNWDEPAIGRWPVERERLDSIAWFIASLYADVDCLQEVSGDQVARLREVERGDVLATRFPRVPACRRRFESPGLRDPGEYLVTIVRGTGARLVAAATFPTDPGKGFQRVELASRVTCVCTHVTYGDARRAQLAMLVGDAGAGCMPTVVCGDFNADRDTVGAELGPAFAPAAPRPGGPRTRPASRPGDEPEDIDHVFVARGTPLDAEVLDGGGRSDHNPVRVSLQVFVS